MGTNPEGSHTANGGICVARSRQPALYTPYDYYRVTPSSISLNRLSTKLYTAKAVFFCFLP